MVVPMTVTVPVPILVRIIVVIVMAVVARIIPTVVYRIRVAIGRSHRYVKVAASLRFLGHEGDEPERQQNWEKIAFHEINVLAL